jgi:uncharacterized protein (TIGR02266 family)
VEKPMTLSMPMVKIRLKCPNLDGFVDRYHADVNMAGIFVRTRSPLATGTPVSFDFRLADDSCLFRGSGVVVWARSDETLAPLLDPGMMLSFDELRDRTRENFEHVLARKRTMEEAADTVPTLVRTFAGERPPLPMTTKMTADDLEALRARMREQTLAEDDAPAPPLQPASDAASAVAAQPEPAGFADDPAPFASEAYVSAEPRLLPLLPMLVPSTPRVHIEGEPGFPEATRTLLAKVLVLRPQPALATDGTPIVDPDRVTAPLARAIEVVEEQRSRRGDVTELIDSPAAPHSLRLVGLGIAGWMLLVACFAVIRLNLVQRMLEWLSGA